MVTIDIFRREADSAVSFGVGQKIFEKGDPAEVLYGVIEGEVEISVDGKAIDRVGAGGIFGEMALIDRTARAATAVAATECRLVPIGEKRFLFLVQQTPFFALSVLRVMAERTRRLMAVQA